MATQINNKPSLFDRKLKLMERLNCQSLFVELDDWDHRIEQLATERVSIDQQLRTNLAQQDEIETLAVLGVEGKNEAERKARKIEILRRDEGWQMVTGAVSEAQAKLAQADADLDSLKRKARRAELQIKYQVAIIAMLGGSGE